MIEAEAPTPPRYLVRRLCAFYLDLALAWILLGFALTLSGYNNFDHIYQKGANTIIETRRSTGIYGGFELAHFKFPIQLITIRCGPASGNFVAFVSESMSSAQLNEVQVCLTRIFGVPDSGRATWTEAVTTQSGKVEQQEFSIDVNLTDGPLKLANLFGILLLITVSAVCSATLQTTPGKRLLGLRFKVGSPKRPIRREIIKNIPALTVILPFIPFQLGWLNAPEIEIFGFNIIGAAVLLVQCAAILWLRIYPLKDEKIALLWSENGEVIRVSKGSSVVKTSNQSNEQS
jgi:hypothetical protein